MTNYEKLSAKFNQYLCRRYGHKNRSTWKGNICRRCGHKSELSNGDMLVLYWEQALLRDAKRISAYYQSILGGK